MVFGLEPSKRDIGSQSVEAQQERQWKKRVPAKNKTAWHREGAQRERQPKAIKKGGVTRGEIKS